MVVGVLVLFMCSASASAHAEHNMIFFTYRSLKSHGADLRQ